MSGAFFAKMAGEAAGEAGEDAAEALARREAKQAVETVAPNGGPITGTRARDILAESLGANPYPVKAEAHHILGVEWFNMPLGQRFHNWGIDLNGPENGVLLPKYDYPGRTASIHSGRTTRAYTEEVTKRLNEATSKDEALEILADLKEELLAGELKINNATGIPKP